MNHTVRGYSDAVVLPTISQIAQIYALNLTVLLSLHDHLIHAVCQQHVTCLCLLDLSAAFDTIDHTILLERLSQWFGVHGTVYTYLV